jgi:hypothetical protein
MSRKIKVDMTGVDCFEKASEGEHVVKIASAEEGVSQGGNDTLNVSFEVIKGADKGCRVMCNYPLVENALWKLKGMLQAIGMKADGKMAIDLDKLVGKQLIIEVVHEEYNGSVRAKVDSCKKLGAESDSDEEDDDDEEDEEEAPKKSAKKPAKGKKKPDPDEDDDDDDEEDDDEEDEEEEEKPSKSKKNAKKPEPKKADKGKKKAAEEDEDDEDEEDEEEEKPSKSKKNAKPSKDTGKKGKKKPADDDDDDDEDWEDA